MEIKRGNSIENDKVRRIKIKKRRNKEKKDIK